MRPGITVEMTREPVGVVGLITPWNFPIAIPAWKAAPALAYGNAVILKPAALVPASAWALVDVLVRAGVPEGVLGLVFGPGGEIGNALVESDGVNAISFTGSVETGRGIAEACARRGVRVQLEMGGKNPLVVLDDADLEIAVDCALQGAYFSTGQRCTASSRLVVTAGIHDRFVAAPDRAPRGDAGRPRARRRRPRSARSSTSASCEQDLDYLAIGRDEGAELAFGGRQLERPTQGHFLEPALFVGRDERDAHRARGDLRTGRRRDPGRRLRRGARRRQRHAVRPLQRHLHDEPAATRRTTGGTPTPAW